MELKTKTWQMIADEVNRVCPLNRTVNHLKDKWRKMCTEVREKAATKNRLERNSSGLNDIEVPQLTDLEEETGNKTTQSYLGFPISAPGLLFRKLKFLRNNIGPK